MMELFRFIMQVLIGGSLIYNLYKSGKHPVGSPMRLDHMLGANYYAILFVVASL